MASGAACWTSGTRRPILLLVLLGSGVPACHEDQAPPNTETAEARQVAATTDRISAIASYVVGAGPRAIAVADFNGDGRPDVAVANAGGGTVTVLFGSPSGRLRGSTSFVAGREPSDVDAVDLDLDGDIDLIVANHETPNVTALSNDGHGRFVPAPGSPFNTGARPHVHGLATGDFDGDGWVDVAVESADAKEVRVLRGGPRGLSAPLPVPVGTMPYFRLGAGDVTGNGRPDVLVPGHRDNTVRGITSERGVLRTAPWTIRLSAQPWMVVAGDVNGDGRHDIVVVMSDAVSVWLASSRGFAQAPRSPFPIQGATEAAIGDLDGDGAADVAVGPWDGDEVTVIVGRATATRRIRMCERPIGLAIADLDGDGRAELLATCPKSNQLTVATMAPR